MVGPFSRSLAWSPTIAMSWLWGLGFFYAIYMALQYGWLGFLSFALTNCAGLFAFGWFVGAPGRDLSSVLKKLETGYLGLFLIVQLVAVAITLYGLVAFIWAPLSPATAALGAAVVTLLSCAVGQRVSLIGLRRLHAIYLAVGLAAALVALFALRAASDAPPLPMLMVDGRFFGLVVPTIVGFFLGPWMDIQQWRRAAIIQQDGGSVRAAYGGGAVLFFVAIGVNALLAAAAGRAGALVGFDGLPGWQPAVAVAIAKLGLPAAAAGYFVWATLAAASTIDSAYNALRETMRAVMSRSVSPLLAFMPAGFIGSPLWVIAGGVAVAAIMVLAAAPQIYLMAPFATLFVGAAASLALETNGAPRRYDPTFAVLVGLAAWLIFVAGYAADLPFLMTIAPLIGLTGALPTLRGMSAGPAPAALAPPEPVALLPATAAPSGAQGGGASYWFDGAWFVARFVPTYDDTNSVGNVYFANYIRYVGKARELFFNHCMPNFELKNTDYFILTRDIRHDFRREAKEFEPIEVRVAIGEYNRKFVKLVHEIVSDQHGVLGRGEQTLMFVNASDLRLLDIPRQVVEGFLPYWPKTPPKVSGRSKADAAPTGED